MKALLRPSLSTFLVAFFFLILLFLGLFAEVFESQTPEVDIAQIYANPVPVNELQHLKTLKLTNKHGSFLFENTDPQGNLAGPWQMLEPQALRVKGDVVAKIIDALNVIRVRNFHRLEPINITSFSLDNPTLTLLFTNTRDKSFEIKMGLINPIDNSAYLSLSSQDQIYQIDPIEMTLESYDLAQLVESKVLAVNLDSLASLEIYGENTLDLKLLKKDDQWVDQSGTVLSEAKVKRFFERLEDMKSFSILDKLNTDQQVFMEKVMATPEYSLKLISASGVRTYVIAPIKGQIPGMNVVKSDTYALSTDERQSFVLIDKDQLRMLSTKSSELK
ncbi:DUF4340 domain-containing protein [Peredibacter sp. HCB2-198]|uniref:DUF4340 domain-containing protein n=1 Tax=Peredibacter sp. HCB2-198 TaxID=3383025 RepID=UPI0038B6936F